MSYFLVTSLTFYKKVFPVTSKMVARQKYITKSALLIFNVVLPADLTPTREEELNNTYVKLIKLSDVPFRLKVSQIHQTLSIARAYINIK